MVSECVGEHGSGPECTGTLAGSFYTLIGKWEEERLGLAWAFESWKHTSSDTCPVPKSVSLVRGQALGG